MTVFDALCAVVQHAPSAYAKAYAKAALNMTGKEQRVQCLYVLSNTKSWRGEQAREAKKVLKEYSNG